MQCKQVGTVEILDKRVYPMDSTTPDPSTSAIVLQGVYPLYELGEAKFWVMEGVLNLGGLQTVGDGLMIRTPHDEISDIAVRFPTRALGPREWKALVDDPVAQEGHKDQRLRIRMGVPK